MTSYYSPLLFTKCLKTSDSLPPQQASCINMTDITDADAFEARHIWSEASVSSLDAPLNYSENPQAHAAKHFPLLAKVLKNYTCKKIQKLLTLLLYSNVSVFGEETSFT